MFQVATSQLLGSVRHFIEYWEPKKLCIPPIPGVWDREKKSAGDEERGYYRSRVPFHYKNLLRHQKGVVEALRGDGNGKYIQVYHSWNELWIYEGDYPGSTALTKFLE